MDNNGSTSQRDSAATEPLADDRTRYPVTEQHLSDLDNRFSYHAPAGDQTDRYHALRSRAYTLATWIMETTPPSREQSLALTKLEESIMWANSAIARHE
jgi:hypothetical protein